MFWYVSITVEHICAMAHCIQSDPSIKLYQSVDITVEPVLCHGALHTIGHRHIIVSTCRYYCGDCFVPWHTAYNQSALLLNLSCAMAHCIQSDTDILLSPPVGITAETVLCHGTFFAKKKIPEWYSILAYRYYCAALFCDVTLLTMTP